MEENSNQANQIPVQPTTNPAPAIQNQPTVSPQISDKSAIVALLLIYLNPVGVFLMWKWMKGWKRWVKILITIPLLIALLGLASTVAMAVIGFNSYQKLNTAKTKTVVVPFLTPTSIPTPTSDATANWKTYTNIEDKFSLKYPDVWEIENPLSGNGAWINFFPRGTSMIHTTNSSFGNETLRIMVYEGKGLFNNLSTNVVPKPSPQTVNGKAAVKNSPNSIDILLQESADEAKVLHIETISKDGKAGFDQILQTLKFTNGDSDNGWQSYTSTKLKDISFPAYSIKFPHNWEKKTRREENIDILTLTNKIGYSLNISQGPYDGGMCVFKGDSIPSQETPYGDLRDKEFIQIETSFGSLRRYESYYPNSKHFAFCQKNKDFYGSLTHIGNISYEIPENYDVNILKEMDNIVKTAEIVK